MNKLLTPEEVAMLLGVKLSTIYQWTHQGFIPHVKLGKFVRFKEKDIWKWIEIRTDPGRKSRKVGLNELLL